jgi:sugar phosphate isomerase/epimerase
MNSSRRNFCRILGAVAAAPVFGASLFNTELAAAKAPETEAGGVKFHLGLASYSFRKFDRSKAIQMTARAGLGYICFKDFHLKLDSTDEECKAAAEECKKAGVNLYGCGVVYMKKPEEVVNVFRYAKAAGMSTIVGAPAPELLPLVDEKIKETGIYLAIHNHGPGDKVYGTPEIVMEKVGKFDQRIGICIDVGHTARIGGDVVKSILNFKDRIFDVHFKDINEKSQKGHGTICGDGVLELPEYLAAFKEIGYDRVVSFEWEEEAEDPLPGLMQNVGYVRGLLRMMK